MFLPRDVRCKLIDKDFFYYVRDANFNTSPLTAFVTKICDRTTMDPLMPDDEFKFEIKFERSFGEQLDKTIQHNAEPLPPHLWLACLPGCCEGFSKSNQK